MFVWINITKDRNNIENKTTRHGKNGERERF